MRQVTIADRHASSHTRRLAQVLLGSLLVLSFLLSGSHATRADESDETDGEAEEPSVGGPDFRFKQPWLILGVRGGWSFNRTHGQIYNFLEDTLTLKGSDLDGPAFTLEAAVRATSWLDVLVGFEVTGRRTKSKFRDFVEEDGDAVKQKTTLTQVPLTASLRLYPIGRGRQVGEHAWIRSIVVPYVGGGLGATYYRLKQKGDFVDFVDLTIFESTLKSDGWAFAKHAFAGVDVKLTKNFGLVLEGRYYWADATLDSDFVGFSPIDLDGARIMAGISWRL